MHRTVASAYATASGVAQRAVPRPRPAVPVREGLGPVVRDLRGRAGRTPRTLAFAPGDLVVVSGLPGSGKSTLIRNTVTVVRIDSQDARERWERRVPGFVPYGVYRPLVRIAHYAGLRAALRSGESVVVHDCGTQAWVRRWLVREARRRGTGLHLLLLDVTPEEALDGQAERGRGVSGYAFGRHRKAVGTLVRDAETGVLPAGCASAVLIDRDAARELTGITFGP